MKTYTINT